MMKKSVRRWLSWSVMIALLFTQLAVAAYACPALGANATQASMAAMESCEGMASLDAEQPGLCLQHCQSQAVQHTDQSNTPSIPPVPLGPVFILASLFEDAGGMLLVSDDRAHVDRASSPPLSILHCCFRF